jgi:serine/threonine protein kinase
VAEPSQLLLTRRGEAERLKAEWEKRFTAEAFRNPPFAEAFEIAVRKRDALRLFEIVHLQASAPSAMGAALPFDDRYRDSVKAIGSKAPPAPGGLPVGLFDYVSLALTAAEGGATRRTEVDLGTIDELLKLGNELLDEPKLSGFRGDILEAFSSTVTPPFSVFLAPARTPDPTKPPVRIELEAFVGRIFRGYRIIAVLGRGGFGAVFLAEHPTLPLKRALKLFLDVDRSGPAFEKFREKCFDEARLQSGLNHENILEVVDAFEDQGYVVLVMEYVDGPNLARVIQEKMRARGRFLPLEVLGLAIPVARGLMHAHKHGVVHRDMKPENILLDQGRPKIADFGLARYLEETGQRHTTAGHLVGTPLYMAPEQIAAQAKTYGPACDIYSFGVVLYQMCLGITPFDHEDRFAILQQHEFQAPDPISLTITDFPEELDRIILTCLEKRPADRFTSADELLLALERCRENLGRGIKTVERQSWERRTRGRRKMGLWAAAGVLGLLLLGAIPGAAALKKWTLGSSDSQPRTVDQKGPVQIVGFSPAKDPEATPKESHFPTVEPRTQPGANEVLAAPKKELPPAERDPRPEPKVVEPVSKKIELPVPRLREKLAAQPAGARATALMGELLGLFEKHERELRSASYDGLGGELDAFEKARLHAGGSEALSSDEALAALHVKAARRMLDLARQAVREHLGRLRSEKGPVVLKIAGGGLVSGKVQELGDGKISLRDDQGGTVTVDVSKLALEEFVPDRGAPAAQLAFQGLTLDPARTLGLALDFEAEDESVLLWAPFLVRLARLEVRQGARATALGARELLAKSKAAPDSTAVLLHHVAFAAAESELREVQARILPVFGYLEPDFASARREKESLELLLARRYSQVLASYPGTAPGPVAGELLLGVFLADLDAGFEELLNGSGWWNNRWEVWPKEPDIKARQKLFDTRDPKLLVFRDPAGMRSLIMNDNTTRAPEGILLRLSFEPEPGQAESAHWSLLLRGGKDGTDSLSLRVDASGIGLYRQVLEPGAKDACLAHAPLPTASGDDPFRAYALVPAEDHLHVFVDGEIVLSLPRESAKIPHQMDFSVCRGTSSVRCMLARKPATAPAEDAGKKKDTKQ